jgi:dipeptide/tripeptide permease
MADKLTLRNTGTWMVVCFGLGVAGFGLAWLVLLLTGVLHAGGDIDVVADAVTSSIRFLVAGVVIAAVGVALRAILRPGGPAP